jgi:hypothetical protein
MAKGLVYGIMVRRRDSEGESGTGRKMSGRRCKREHKRSNMR